MLDNNALSRTWIERMALYIYTVRPLSSSILTIILFATQVQCHSHRSYGPEVHQPFFSYLHVITCSSKRSTKSTVRQGQITWNSHAFIFLLRHILPGQHVTFRTRKFSSCPLQKDFCRRLHQHFSSPTWYRP